MGLYDVLYMERLTPFQRKEVGRMKARLAVSGLFVIGLLAGLTTGCDTTPTVVEPHTNGEKEEVSPISTPYPPRTSPLSPPPTPLPTLPTIEITREPEVGLMSRDEAIALAKQALSEHLDIDEASIEVVWIEPVTWSDTSLGCPEKGKVYAQVLVPGYRVLLQVGEEEHDVHIGNGRAVVCERSIGPPLIDEVPAAAQAYDLAREDLAHRLDVPVTEIKAVLIRPATWPDGSLGCPQPGETYPQTPTEGFVVLLEHRNKVYEYHTDGERLVLCTTPSP